MSFQAVGPEDRKERGYCRIWVAESVKSGKVCVFFNSSVTLQQSFVGNERPDRTSSHSSSQVRRGGYVFAAVCLSVCPKEKLKVSNEILRIF